jgi:hypothetical protein
MDVEVKPISGNVGPARREAPPPKPAAPSLFARRVRGEWRRMRQGFNRQNVITFAKAMAWVVPLTLLIWVYAETGLVDTRTNVQIRIELHNSDPKHTIKLIRPPDKFILCDLEGQRSNLESFIDKLSPTDPLIINIDTTNMPLDENSLRTKQEIMDNPRLKALGITVDKCEPDALTFLVDLKDQRTATVTAPPGISTLKSATYDPPTILITGAKHDLDAMEVNGQLSVMADIANLPALSTPGQHVVPNVPLRPLDDLTYSKDKVTATLIVTDPDVRYTLSNGVPVLLTATRKVLNDYTINWDGSFSGDIYLIGPPDKIAQINRDVYPYLELKITSTDVTNPHPVQLQLRDLPDGVRLVPGQSLTQSFTATPR